LRTAVDGKSFSGGALNRAQKLLRICQFLSVQRQKKLYLTAILANQTACG
jgi:hypothetical protein